MSDLKGKVIIVTGANGGLGNPVTQTLLDAGATVVGVSSKIEQSEFKSSAFTAVPANLLDTAAVKNLVEQTLSRFGRIDVLAHLVGAFAGGKPIAETDDKTFQFMFDVNVKAAFNMFRAVIPAMRQARSGRIIAIGSRAAEDPGPTVGAYSASKAAVVSLVRTIARENKDAGITANSILPGTIDTAANRSAMPKADTSQWVQPTSIASLIVWLASDAGKDVTGAAIPVYGAGL
ncbi:MAG TPA: SDR family NAD(P)-dependent oxidoreductase [Terriglobales bacterium]|jgi:NAD(P)-dependent dehydrogenase (short-subunit alcohol dehydrogenase family)